MIALKKPLQKLALASVLAFSGASFAVDIDHSADENDVAIQGYDPVSYFTASAAQQGSDQFTATYKNAIYKFTTAENRDAFKADPTQYAPQYGGFCAFGTAMGKKFDTDPNAWKVVDNKLYLNLSKDVQERWLADVPGFIEQANGNWGDIKDKNSEDL